MKQRVRVVIVENEKLHEELKAKAVEDTLKEYTFANSTVLFSMRLFAMVLLIAVANVTL